MTRIIISLLDCHKQMAVKIATSRLHYIVSIKATHFQKTHPESLFIHVTAGYVKTRTPNVYIELWN